MFFAFVFDILLSGDFIHFHNFAHQYVWISIYKQITKIFFW